MAKETLRYEWWEAVFEVDEIPETAKWMEEQLLFFSSGKELIEKYGVKQGYFKLIAPYLISLSMTYNLFGVKEEFKEMEGFADLDGNYGIKLISIDEWEFYRDEFTLERTEN
jgi:hypothetical protein